MTIDKLFENAKLWKDFDSYQKALDANKTVTIHGIEGSCANFFATALGKILAKNNKILYIASNDFSARQAFENINGYADGRAVLLERSEYMFYNALAKSEESDYRRMETLRRVAMADFDICVASVGAVVQYVLPKDYFENLTFEFKVGGIYDISEVGKSLVKLGYVRTPVVDGKREFSIRGDIVDIFPTSWENPVRIEFYGDEIDTIRTFDVLTQRSIENIDAVSILAESEFQMGLGARIDEIESTVLKSLERKCGRTMSKSTAEQYKKQIQGELELLKAGVAFPGRDRYVPFVIGRHNTIFDYFDNPLVYIENKSQIISAIEAMHDEQHKMCTTIADSLCVLDEVYELFMDTDELMGKIDDFPVTYLEKYDDDGTNRKSEGLSLNFKMKNIAPCAGNDIMLRDILSRWEESLIPVYVFVDKEERFAKLVELLKGKGNISRLEPVICSVTSGFEAESFGFAVVNENTFYTKSQRKKTKKRAYAGDAIENFADIAIGDYVVHDVHGIGIFEGFCSRESDGVMKDFVVVRYAENGKLWIPTLHLDQLHKYIGSDGYVPRINTLGGKDWNNQKERVKKQLRDYVDELAQLYAKRSSIEGYTFSKDTPWQQEFEADFEHEPTDDQVTSVEEIKRDMESPHPMERLLCGDVGFGKTEVALRAAFKAILDGKQVAFLCPTTVLCQQHYFTIKSRFEKYPVEVDYVCRFRTEKEKKQIFKRLKEGEVDLLIGTHSLLQKSAEFKELGLIIVDEEQRFGVLQKEKLKMKYPKADMLYLSATPIPRTLNMSLSKIRDISLLTDPPKSRNPVQTYVIEMDPMIIKNAIYREMARHGQVFYLYNRVQNMGEVLMKLQELVPEARIAMAHGQMPERELEDVMKAFVDGEYDVLLCSAIIESGLDIPSANTIIVENGHTLGLAQLYQIRGRVGRSDRRAYAYITVPKGRQIGEDAEKRLSTIKEFTEFGSGFKVAMRDLQIRGAGSVLGERQHGDVSSIGYDMYCKLLNDMILEATGAEVPEPEIEVNVNLAVDSFISESWISDKDTRLELYQKIAKVKSDEDIMDLTDELIDRFGKVPQNIVNMMHLSKLKVLASDAGLRSISQSGDKIELTVQNAAIFDRCLKENFTELNKNYRGKFNVMMGEGRLYAEFKFSSTSVVYDQKKMLQELEKLLEILVKKQEES